MHEYLVRTLTVVWYYLTLHFLGHSNTRVNFLLLLQNFPLYHKIHPDTSLKFMLNPCVAHDTHLCCAVLLLQLCLTLCNPMGCSSPGSSVHGILQARILELVAISFSRGSSQFMNQIHISCGSLIVGGFFTDEPSGKPMVSSTVT